MTDAKQLTDNSLIFFNVFTPKEGQFDALVAAQQEILRELAGKVPGSRGSRLHVTLNRTFVTLEAHFESADHHQSWIKSPEFAERAKRLSPLIKETAGTYYRTVLDTTTNDAS